MELIVILLYTLQTFPGVVWIKSADVGSSCVPMILVNVDATAIVYTNFKLHVNSSLHWILLPVDYTNFFSCLQDGNAICGNALY